ncbi:MAG: hypothetical protein ACRC62_25195, partial [Microcoleus sp.]
MTCHPEDITTTEDFIRYPKLIIRVGRGGAPVPAPIAKFAKQKLTVLLIYIHIQIKQCLQSLHCLPPRL